MKRKSSNFIAFDLGSSKILGLASHINSTGEIVVSAQSIYSSEGLKSGVVLNMELAENSIIGALYALEKGCDKSIKHAAISLSGAHVKSYYVSKSIPVNSKVVTSSDVKKLINKTLAEFNVSDKEIIHYFPIIFKINNNQVVDNPVDLYAREISCQVHVVAAQSGLVMNLVKCFMKQHVDVNSIILSVYASALATLTENELEIGSTIIDMGANTTSYAIMSKGKLIYTNAILIGGDDITLSIAKKLSISIKDAEKLKILYGNADPKLVAKDIIIDLDSESRSTTSIEISKIISPIIEDIFTQIKKQCQEMAVDSISAEQVVITGGGAALAGIKRCASNIFQKQIRIARAPALEGFVEDYNPLSQSTLFGMAKFKLLSMQRSDPSHGLSEDISFLKRVFIWIKNNI